MIEKILMIYEEELFADGLERLLKEQNPNINYTKCLMYEDIESILSKNTFDLVFITKNKNFDISYICPLIKRHNMDCKIVLLARAFPANDIKKFMEYSVNGLICKKYSTQKIRNIVGLLLMGENYYPSEILPYGKTDFISPQQRKIVECLRKGYSNKQIAYELGIAESTVKVHMTSIMKKLNCTNRIQVIQKVLEQGLIEYE